MKAWPQDRACARVRLRAFSLAPAKSQKQSQKQRMGIQACTLSRARTGKAASQAACRSLIQPTGQPSNKTLVQTRPCLIREACQAGHSHLPQDHLIRKPECPNSEPTRPKPPNEMRLALVLPVHSADPLYGPAMRQNWYTRAAQVHRPAARGVRACWRVRAAKPRLI